MEFAGDPTKMSKILGSFNNANLGKVANAGTIQNAKSEANTILNNFKANDAIAEMAYKADAAEATRDYRSEVAGIEQSAIDQNTITSGIGSLAGSAMRGADFSLFGGGGGGGTDTMGASDFDAFGRSAADQRTLSNGGFIDHGYI